MIKPIARISVAPNLPPELDRLQTLAYNLRWSWDHDTIALFRRFDDELWFQSNRNPVWMLGLVKQERLHHLVEDPSFMVQLESVWNNFQTYMNDQNTWYRTHYGAAKAPYIAYFSMEFGLTACLRNYSGGLGVLSGDHMKSAATWTCRWWG
ncbi:MAG: DUF3417 domain-containing protein [Anaerolineae bacterium]|nr:DUF3417 domain-containing protein [Anaerolineae bacterium]